VKKVDIRSVDTIVRRVDL